MGGIFVGDLGDGFGELFTCSAAGLRDGGDLAREAGLLQQTSIDLRKKSTKISLFIKPLVQSLQHIRAPSR